MIKYTRRLLAASLLLILSTIALAQPTFTNIIVFGDSLSDIGNVSSAPFTNHQSDGKTPIWVNDVVTQLFSSTPIYPSTHQPSSNDVATLNLDYAWGGALTGTYNTNGVPPVSQQIQTFLADVQHKPSKTALYVIWAGANDLFSLVPHADMTTQQQQATLKTATCDLTLQNNLCVNTSQPPVTPIANLVNEVKTLQSAGIPSSQIYVLNLPDLSYTPKAIALTKGDKNLLTAISALSELFNANLGLDMEATLPADHLISAYAFMHQVMSDPAKYNFTDVSDSCVSKQAEPTCQGYIFNDSIHPTVAAHLDLSHFIEQSL